MYLLDTNILSLIGPSRNHSEMEAAVRDWIGRTQDMLYLSVISISEIELGIAKAARQGASRKAEDLAGWLNGIVHLYANRILLLDLHAARLAGQLLAKAYSTGGDPRYEYAAIAATAITQKLTVLTRNTRHFEAMDAPYLNPYQDFPAR